MFIFVIREEIYLYECSLYLTIQRFPMKSQIRNLMLIGIAGVMVGCSTSSATFHALDSNNDSSVSKKEFRSQIQKQAFENLDQDSDKYITRDEWDEYETVRQPGKRFAEMDKNSDKKLSFTEFSNLRRKHLTLNNLFGTLDRDSDGLLTKDEIDNR